MPSRNKVKSVYICSECGATQPKWSGKCPECGAWNTLNEEIVVAKSKKPHLTTTSEPKSLITGEKFSKKERVATGIEEFDRVVGGGFVLGSVILLAGDPGIGKSTVMLQILDKLKDEKFLYFSVEESYEQISIRANRLGIKNLNILISCENNLENILYQIDNINPSVIVVDSIQTIFSDNYDNVPGSVTQVRECANSLLRKSKELGIITVFIGHITKEGMIAGPKVLEHIVDTVLYLEGSKDNFYRILRSIKNRFGPTNEVGVFEMKESGLTPVMNPSEIFLSERRKNVSGSSVAVSMEGTRPFLIEVQSLVTQTAYGTPQRTANGIDYRRLMMLIAVLEKRIGLPLGTQDVFVNLIGGLRIDEPAIDLAITSAIASSFKNIPLPPDSVMMGEVGLVGEVRAIPFIEDRIKEAAKMGFSKIYIPKGNRKGLKNYPDVKLNSLDSLSTLFNYLL
jgi:DNA repair protein RadA/Sms